MNRAIDGDIVAVEVFPESEWKAPGDQVVDQESKPCLFRSDLSFPDVLAIAVLKNDDAEDSEDEEHEDDVEAEAERRHLHAESAKKLAAEKQPTGRIVGIIKRNWRS